MSVLGVSIETLIFLVIALFFGGIGWRNASDVVGSTSVVWFLLGYIALIALSIMAAANQKMALVAGLVYSVLMGIWMGAISRVYEAAYDGIVAQAMLASVGAFLGSLLLYMTGIVKASPKFTRIIFGATIGIGLMYLLSLIFRLFGADLLMINEPTPLGIGLSIAICVVAAASLIVDFVIVDRGVKSSAPVAMEWYCAFGIISTLVWLYMEILRLISLLRSASN